MKKIRDNGFFTSEKALLVPKTKVGGGFPLYKVFFSHFIMGFKNKTIPFHRIYGLCSSKESFLSNQTNYTFRGGWHFDSLVFGL